VIKPHLSVLRVGGFIGPASWLLALVLAAPAAHAGLFDDAEARKAILDLRTKQEQTDARSKAATDQLLEQISQLKRSLFDLNNQLEQLRMDIAKMRGTDEQLTRDVVELQRTQKDVQQGVEDRIKKLEPQKASIDGKEFTVEPEERRQFEESMAVLRKGDFGGAISALSAFNKRYPNSGYRASGLFWLGNAQYGMREYKEAMASFRAMISAAPDHARAPEALLSIANCQMELKDSRGAKKTLDDLLKTYPKSEAAQAGKERLASLK